MHATIDDNHLKDLMKIALMELLEEHPAMLRGLMAEALEDMTAERPRGERDEEDDDEPIRERVRRHTRPRRSRAHPATAEERHSEDDHSEHSEPLTENWDNSSTAAADNLDDSGPASYPGIDPFLKKAPPAGDSPYASSAPPRPRPRAARIPLTGSEYLLQGLSLLLEADLRPYIAIPAVASMLAFSLAVWLGMGQFGAFGNWGHGYLPFWLGWIEWLLWPFFTIAPVTLIFYFFTMVANFFVAPFNALLAEKVARHINGLSINTGPGFGSALLRFPSLLKEEWRKSMWFLIRALLLTILFFIPLINLAAPFIWGIFAAWSLSLKYLDYPVRNQDLEFDETRAIAAENRWLVLGFGGSVFLMTIIPVLNFIVIPAAVIGAAALWTERMATQGNPSI